jgi:hypothetical protein
MAGVTLGFLRYVLGFDSLSFEKGIKKADADLARMQKRFAQTGAKMANIGKTLSLGLTAPLAAFATKGVHEAQRQVDAMAQVNAALKSTAGAAEVTAEQLDKTSKSFEMNSLFESEDILNDVSARLLAFGNIHGAIFMRAQQDILDYAQRSGKDLGTSAILIGKALDNPAKAEGALRKAGVTLNDSQRELIKSMVATGNTAGAQAVLLGALETKFRDAAKVAADVDPYHKMHVAFKQMAETVGAALLPLIPPLTAAITAVAAAFTGLSPETQKWLIIIGGLSAVLGPSLVAFGNLISIVSKIGPAVTIMVKAWEVLRVAFLAARIAALATLPALVPFLVPLGAIALAVGAVYLAWKNWDKIVAVVKLVYTAVKTWVMDKLGAVWDWMIGKLGLVAEKFRWLYDVVIGHSYIPDMVDGIAAEMARLDAVMVAPVAAATSKAADAFRALQESTKGLLDRLFPEAASLNQLKSEMATLEAAMKSGILTAGQYAEALQRLQTEGLSNEPISVLDTGSLVPGSDDIVAGIGALSEKLPQVVDRAQQLHEVLGNVGQDLAQLGGDWLSAFIEGTATLEDLWKGVLSYAIRALSSQNGPLQALFGGPRASGGPVSSGMTYLVGEKGPELFQPGRSGRIVSNDDSRRMAGGWGRGDVSVNVYGVTDLNSFNRSERQIARSTKRRLGLA